MPVLLEIASIIKLLWHTFNPGFQKKSGINFSLENTTRARLTIISVGLENSRSKVIFMAHYF